MKIRIKKYTFMYIKDGISSNKYVSTQDKDGNIEYRLNHHYWRSRIFPWRFKLLKYFDECKIIQVVTTKWH